MKCSNCGNEIEPGSRYCSVCGFFTVPDYEETKVTEPAIFRDHPEDVVPEVPELPGRNKGIGNKGVVFALAALFVLLGLVVFLLIYPQIRRIEELAKEKDAEPEVAVVTEVSDDYDEQIVQPDEEEVEETDESNEAETAEEAEEDLEEVDYLTVNGDPGDKLMMVDGTIYNDNGGSISGLYEGEARVGEFYISEYQTAGVLCDSRKTCLYITPDLNTEPLAKNVYNAGLSYSGDYVFYKAIDGNYNKYLYLFEVATGERYRVEDTGTIEMIMSPSGEYIAYIKHDEKDYNKKLLMLGGWDKHPEALAEDVDEIYAVSDDGRMIVYSTFNKRQERTMLCWDNGNIVKLADDFVLTMHFNRKCSSFLFERDSGVFYYETGMSEPEKVVDGKPYNFIVDGKRQKVSPEHVNKYLYATESLVGAVVRTKDNLYMLKDGMESVIIGDEVYGALLVNRLSDRDIVVYYGGYSLAYKMIGFDGSIETVYPIGEGFPGGYAINDDGSLLWYYDDTEEKVYMVDVATGTKMSVFGKVTKKGTITLLWDSYTQRCFLISEDGCSYGIDESGDVVEYATDCAEHYTSFKYDDMVGYEEKSREGYKYILVFGRYVEVS